MITPKIFGVFTIIPSTILLTISFFVLVVLRKIQEQALKTFGYVIAVLLWIAAALILSTGIYVFSTGRHPMMCMMQEMMGPPTMSGMPHKMMHKGKGMGKSMETGGKPQEMKYQQQPAGQDTKSIMGK